MRGSFGFFFFCKERGRLRERGMRGLDEWINSSVDDRLGKVL